MVTSSAAILAMPPSSAQPAGAVGSPADAAAIRAAASAYREALAKGDAAAVKAAWIADGDIVDGWGNRLRPDDIAGSESGAAAGATKRPEFRMGETDLRFITADVAVEDGNVDVVLPGMQTSIEGWFSALWVRSGGSWKLAGLRESERPVVADSAMLADLDWMVGDWTLAVDEPIRPNGNAPPDSMVMSVRWDAGRSFLIREVRIPAAATDGDAASVVEVHQRIGWDPVVRRIRSWSFSSDGSRGEATWFRDGHSWVAVQTGIMPDGRQDTAANIYSHISSPDGRDRCVWRILPDALNADDDQLTQATWVRTPKGVDR
jgi:hypothetical protein